MHDPSDAQLVSAVGQGQTAALATLVRRHQEKVLALAFRILGRWDLAEDVAQETFLRVLGAAGRYQPDAKFTTWLYRIVVNLCFDMQRRRKRAPASLASDFAGPVGDDPAESLQARRRAEAVRRAATALPVRQRTMLVLHRYQGLSHREIAHVTCCSISAVESLLVRAYANLREALTGLAENDE